MRGRAPILCRRGGEVHAASPRFELGVGRRRLEVFVTSLFDRAHSLNVHTSTSDTAV